VDFVVCTLAVKKKIRAGFDMSDRTIPLSAVSSEFRIEVKSSELKAELRSKVKSEK
jgi:hypothetical protein